MLRTAASRALRQVAPQARQGAPPLVAPRLQDFHVSLRRDEEAKAVEPPKQEGESMWSPLHGIAAGIFLAVPALYYEWYLINEETQLAGCFIAFCGSFHKLAGPALYEAGTKPGLEIMAKSNAAEDAMLSNLNVAIEDMKSQQGLLSDLEAMKELKAETYVKLNETGKIKPLYAYKAQMEKILSVIAAEEVASEEKAKMALMAEATEAVRADFAASKDLQKKSLANAVAFLKGSKSGADPVKESYLKFFADKKKAAEKVDEATELKQARAALITKMSTVAMTEKFYFEFDSSGAPKMAAS